MESLLKIVANTTKKNDMETPYDTVYLYNPISIIDFIENKLYKHTNKNTENRLKTV